MSRIKILLVALIALSLFAASCGSDDAIETVEAAAAAPDESATDDADDADDEEAMEDEEAMDEEAMEDEEAMDEEAMDGEEAMTDDEEAMAEESSGDFPVTIESAGGTFTLDAAPQRIISLSPSATEMLFAIGAGEQVVAVDAFSNYPETTPVTELSGWDPNVEAVLAFEPDLIVIANDANDLVASATAAGVPVFVSAAPLDIESGYASFADLGVAVGRVDETAAAITTMRAEVEAAFASAPVVPVRIYHELDETFFSASSFGFIGAVYAGMGVENIADAADTDGFGFPQLSQEYIVEADPQLIVITDQVSYTADDVAARAGWEPVSAIVNDNIVVVNADIASRWGPRLPQFISVVADALNSVTADA